MSAASIPALKALRREGRRSDGWASRPAGVRNSTLRDLLADGDVEVRPGAYPTYRVSAAGHAKLAEAAKAAAGTPGG